MRLLRRRIRGFFALEAILLFLAVALSLARPSHAAASPLRHYGMAALDLALGSVFALAWATTRKPSPYRSPWAILASLISLAGGAWLACGARANPTSAAPGLIALAIGATGLYLFAQGGDAPAGREAASIPEPAAASPPLAPISGDRTSPWVQRVFTVVSVAAQLGCVVAWSVWARRHGLQHAGRMPWFVLFTAAVLASTLFHEAGHALVAWGFEMKLLSFNAGPFTWRKRSDAWAFKFSLAGFDNLGGAVHAVPTHPGQPRSDDLWMIAAGPLSNLLFGTIAIVFVLRADWPLYEQTWRLVAFFGSFCYIAALTNLLPFRTAEGGYSDGARILQILTRSPIEDFHRTLAALASTRVSPRRYRDLDLSALERAAGHIPDPAAVLHLHLAAVKIHLDAGRLPEAAGALAQAELLATHTAIDLPAGLCATFVFAQAVLNRNPIAARLWADRMHASGTSAQAPAQTPAQTPEHTIDTLLAESALHWVEGRQLDAEATWRRADAEAFTLPETGSGNFDRHRTAILRTTLDTPAPAVPASSAPSLPASPQQRISSRPLAPQAPSVLDRLARPLPDSPMQPPARQPQPSAPAAPPADPAFALARIARPAPAQRPATLPDPVAAEALATTLPALDTPTPSSAILPPAIASTHSESIAPAPPPSLLDRIASRQRPVLTAPPAPLHPAVPIFTESLGARIPFRIPADPAPATTAAALPPLPVLEPDLLLHLALPDPELTASEESPAFDAISADDPESEPVPAWLQTSIPEAEPVDLTELEPAPAWLQTSIPEAEPADLTELEPAPAWLQTPASPDLAPWFANTEAFAPPESISETSPSDSAPTLPWRTIDPPQPAPLRSHDGLAMPALSSALARISDANDLPRPARPNLPELAAPVSIPATDRSLTSSAIPDHLPARPPSVPRRSRAATATAIRIPATPAPLAFARPAFDPLALLRKPAAN